MVTRTCRSQTLILIFSPSECLVVKSFNQLTQYSLCFSTGEKPHSCPDCPFTTADPGSLTRHRKNTHNYIPKKGTSKAKPAGTKQSRRRTPYSRACSAESVSTSSSTWSLQSAELFLDFCQTLYTSSSPIDKALDISQDNIFSYSWDKDPIFSEDISLLSASEYFSTIPLPEIPQHLFPATDAGRQLEGDNDFLKALSLSPKATPTMSPSLSFDEIDAFLAQYPTTPATISPTDTYINQPHVLYASQAATVPANPRTPEYPLIPDVAYQQSFKSPGVNNTMDSSFYWNSPDAFSPTSSPEGSTYGSSPSSSSYSSPSPSNSSFVDYPTSAFSMPDHMLDFVFPEPTFIY